MKKIVGQYIAMVCTVLALSIVFLSSCGAGQPKSAVAEEAMEIDTATPLEELNTEATEELALEDMTTEPEVFESIAPEASSLDPIVKENGIGEKEPIEVPVLSSNGMASPQPITKTNVKKPGAGTTNKKSTQKGNAPKVVQSKMLVNCPKEMIEGNEYNILACIFQEGFKEEVIEAIANANEISVTEVEESTKIKRVVLTDKFTVSIIYDKKDFQLLNGTASFKGSFKNKKQWFEWFIKPISTGANKQISISVENIDEKGEKYTSIPSERIKVNVEVNKSGFFDNLWIQIRDNAKWTITVLIIPIVSYIFRRRKRKAGELEDTEE